MKTAQSVISLRIVSSCVAGLALFVSVQILGLNGIASPWWFVAGVVAFLVLIDQKDAPTSILTLVGLILGLLPVAGFLPLSNQLSTLGLLLGVFVSVKGIHARHASLTFGMRGLAAVVPPVVGSTFTYWWWSDLLKGSKEQILTRLMTQWDLSTHFLFFSSIERDGRYLLLSSPPSDGDVWQGRDYPAGIHYVWSQFALGLRETSMIDRSILVPFFGQAIVITGAVTVAVIGLAFARLGRTPLAQFWSGMIGSALGTALFCAGPLSATYWMGYANAPAVVIGIALLVTFLLRSHHNGRVQFLMFVTGALALALNWFPTLGLFAPAIVIACLHQFSKRGRNQIVTISIFVLISLLPVLWLLRNIGLTTVIEATGGVNKFPEQLLIGGAILALGLTMLVVGKAKLEIVVMLATPAILLYGLGRYMVANVGDLRYYFHKFGLFVGTYLVVLIVALIFIYVESFLASNSSNFKNRFRLTIGVVVFSAAITQLFGYWGPELKGLDAQTSGPLQRLKLMEKETKASDFEPLSAVVLRESAINRERNFDERSCMLLVLPKSVATDAASEEYGLVFGDGDPANSLWLANIWFQALSDSATTEAFARTPRTTELGRVFDDYPPLQESRIDETIEATFTPDEVCILSTREINAELRKKSPAWRTFDIES